MNTVNVPNVYTTPYTTCKGDSCVQASKIIEGTPGKQIKIESVTMSLGVVSRGAVATAWVTAVIGDSESTIATFTEMDSDYQEKKSTPDILAPEGKSVTLKFHLKTTASTIRAKMTDITYSYSTQDAEVKAPPYLVFVECDTLEKANELVENMNIEGVNVYTNTSN